MEISQNHGYKTPEQAAGYCILRFAGLFNLPIPLRRRWPLGYYAFGIGVSQQKAHCHDIYILSHKDKGKKNKNDNQCDFEIHLFILCVYLKLEITQTGQWYFKQKSSVGISPGVIHSNAPALLVINKSHCILYCSGIK